MELHQRGRALAIGAALLVAGCVGEPEPCVSDTDCAGTPATPTCDRDTGLCLGPCTEDRVNDYVCMDGVRVYCADDSSLPCTVCRGVCSAAEHCAAATEGCAPDKPAGEPCESGEECLSGGCGEDGACSVAQGEACTASTCDGVCATANDDSTVCLRPCSVADCDVASGEWACIAFSVGSYCVPTCTSCFGSCPIGSCDAACNESMCVDFCAPPELNPDVFCS